MATEDEIRSIKRQWSSRLMSLPGVSGVGIEKDDAGGFVLAVHVDGPDVAQRLPPELHKYPVKVIHSGPFRKFPSTRRP
jgi:hypothetical protein